MMIKESLKLWNVPRKSAWIILAERNEEQKRTRQRSAIKILTLTYAHRSIEYHQVKQFVRSKAQQSNDYVCTVYESQQHDGPNAMVKASVCVCEWKRSSQMGNANVRKRVSGFVVHIDLKHLLDKSVSECFCILYRIKYQISNIPKNEIQYSPVKIDK